MIAAVSLDPHTPSSEPTRGQFVAHGMTVWNGDCTIEVARCVSRQLCPAGNVANARKLALGTEALALLEERPSDFEARVVELLERAGLRAALAKGGAA
ncbi:hypothetical protein LDO31_02830 [Luteimonas sp. XNQY3]|nr:hypothetical protein [Luteimonas sp. XNQY3]MCD9005181.1 hypothetical protein [Luteimonas sp. XNQY3]